MLAYLSALLVLAALLKRQITALSITGRLAGLSFLAMLLLLITSTLAEALPAQVQSAQGVTDEYNLKRQAGQQAVPEAMQVEALFLIFLRDRAATGPGKQLLPEITMELIFIL